MSAPHRRWRLTLDLEADSFDRLVGALEQLALDLSLRPGAEPNPRDITSGAPDAGYVARITEDPSITPESYRAALETWIAERRATMGGRS